MFRGTLVLTISSVLVRVIGALYRIALVRIIGAEGIGLFSMAFSVYVIAISVSSLGLPVALSRVVAQRSALRHWQTVDSAIQIAWYISILSGFCVMVIVILTSNAIASKLLADSRSDLTIRSMAAGIWFATMSAILRGYFQGQQNMVPTSVSQLLEQCTRVPVALLLAWQFSQLGPAQAAAGAGAGMAWGELAGFLCLLLFMRTSSRQTRVLNVNETLTPYSQLTSELFTLSLPVMLNRLAGSLSGLLDASLIPRMLQAGGAAEREATRLLGQLSGMALPLVFLPTVLIFPLSVALLPAISAASSRNREHALGPLRKSLGVTILLGLVSAASFYLMPDKLSMLLYNTVEIKYLVKILGTAVPIAYIQYITTATLNGLGLTQTALGHSLLGIGLKLVLVLLLVPGSGLVGACIAFIASWILVTALNLDTIARHLNASITSLFI